MFDHPQDYSGFRDKELLVLAARINRLDHENREALIHELELRGLETPNLEHTPIKGNCEPNQ